MTTTAEMTWPQHQEWERQWHGSCANTFSEEAKGITYAHRMGLLNEPDPYTGAWPSFDLGGRSVIDIGGGPSSLLLKCRNGGNMYVVDPCHYPVWVVSRYQAAGIIVNREPGENIQGYAPVDEAWIYNCLQHTLDPRQIVANAMRVAGLVRIFEWIDTPPEPGHPHTLTAAALNEWVGATGTMEDVNENGCVGAAWFGAFTAPVPVADATVPTAPVTHVGMPSEFAFRSATTTPPRS